MSNSWLDLNKKICLITLVMASAWLIAGCSGAQVLRPIDGNNCVDFTLKERKEGDLAVFGYYKPAMAQNETHIWIKRDETCYDNMNKSGFDCDDERYHGWIIDWDGKVFKDAYAKRG